ncbi:hypothetical protein LTR95_015934 [Oleoguttula sp. CCFEE 5521]
MSLPTRSNTAQSRFSRQGFEPIADNQHNMTGDATIDIPMEQMHDGAPLKHTQTGASTLKKRVMFRGRRRKPEAQAAAAGGHTGYDGEEDTITAMGKFYKRVLAFSIITRYLVYVLPLGLCIAVPIIVGATAAQNAEIGGVRIVWFFMWVEVAWVSLWVSKIVAHFLPYLFQWLVGVVNSGIRKYSLVLRSLEIPLSLVGWAVTSLATFMPIMTRNPTTRSLPKTTDNPDPTGAKSWESIVQKILAAAVVASLIYLGEKLIIQLISINYHRKQFSSRIRESKHNIYLLSQLYQASISLFPAYCNEFAEEDFTIRDEISLGLSKGRGHARSGSRTPMKILNHVGRVGDKISGAFGNIAAEITGREVFSAGTAHAIVTEALERKLSSEALAKRLWMSFVVEGNEALTQEDLMDVLGDQHREDAEEAFLALDQDANNDISLDEMIMTVVEFGRERKAITTSMHDVDQAINVLDRLFLAVVFIAVVFVFVAFLNANFTTTLATTGTALLSLSFVFAATCQEVLGSCIFLFVKHPYDIGDRVDIGATDQYTVEHISLLFTVFRRVNGAKCGGIVQINHIVLNTQNIENLSRSKAMMEEYVVLTSFDTSFEDIQILKKELSTFVAATDNSRDFQQDINIEVLGTTDMKQLQLQVQIKHKGNWANETLRAARRSKFMCALVAAMRAVPIYGPGQGDEAAGSVGNPTYSVAIDDAIAVHNREAAAKAKEGKRLVPTKVIEMAKESLSPITSRSPGAGLTASDARAVEELNARNPADDQARDEPWTSGNDNSTLGRQSIDEQDLEDVRGLLRRESTRGKRRAGQGVQPAYNGPSVPTINEPVSYRDYAHPATDFGSATNTAYNPPSSRAQQAYAPPTGGAQMSQMPARQASNPYRNRSESAARKPMSPTAGSGDMGDEEFSNLRPYSGV